MKRMVAPLVAGIALTTLPGCYTARNRYYDCLELRQRRTEHILLHRNLGKLFVDGEVGYLSYPGVAEHFRSHMGYYPWQRPQQFRRTYRDYMRYGYNHTHPECDIPSREFYRRLQEQRLYRQLEREHTRVRSPEGYRALQRRLERKHREGHRQINRGRSEDHRRRHQRARRTQRAR